MNGHARRIAAAVNRLAPDVVLFTGDSIDRADRLGELQHFLTLLNPATRGYAILGNWEHWAGVDLLQLRGVYAKRGIRLLVNETAVVPHAGRVLLITGLDGLPAFFAVQGLSSAMILLRHTEEESESMI